MRLEGLEEIGVSHLTMTNQNQQSLSKPFFVPGASVRVH
jgi:hypothetical protein